MRKILGWFFALFVVGATALSAQVPSPGTGEELAAHIRGLQDLEPDPSRVGAVAGVTVSREAVTFELREGRVAPIVLGGRDIGFVYVGEGAMRFTPEGRVEVAQMIRTYEEPGFTGPD